MTDLRLRVMQSPQLLRLACRLLSRDLATPQQKRSHRVASRWLLAYMDAAYDLFFRLQILEGAAGVPVDTWWGKGKQALPYVIDKFQGDTLAPGWLEPGNTGMYQGLKAALNQLVKTTGVASTPDDILNTALMGLSTSATTIPRRILRPAYEVGRYLAVRIQNGDETPATVAKGPLQKLLKRRVLTEARDQAQDLSIEQETEEGRGTHTRDVSRSDTQDAGDLLIKILFRDFTDPLGKEIRQFMRQSWANSKEQRFMDVWLDTLEEEVRIPSLSEVGRNLGDTPTTEGYGQRNYSALFWRPAWKRFFGDLWANKALLRKLENRYQQEGVPWLLEKPNIEDLLAPRVRASLISRVASRYLEDVPQVPRSFS